MDYIFGKRQYDGKETEFIKTIDSEYTNFIEGQFMELMYDNGAMRITNKFRILWKYKEEVDLEGKYNTWYYIDNHTREVDKTPAINTTLADHAGQLADQSEAIDDIIIELLTRGE